MKFLLPHALLLLIPLGFLLWKMGRLPGPPRWLRWALLVLVVGAIAQPEIVWRSAGSDVVVVVDRSRSMPPGSEARAEELIRLLEQERRNGDRLGVVVFGRQARVENAPGSDSNFGGFQRAVDGEASDLSAALDLAGELIPPGRAGRVLVVSDGQATGLDARGAARRLAARGLSVDYRWLAREDTGVDVAVTSVDVPSAVAVKEPFQLTATVHANQASTGTVTLERNGQPLVKGPFEFRAGDNVLTFRDLIDQEGLALYRVLVEVANDGVVENDVGRAVLRVEGPPRVLLLTQSPRGTLAKTLTESGMRLEVRPPSSLSMDVLDGVGTVVLENVEAGTLSESGLHVLSQYVKEAGGGLVMTGGRKSFGEGGYRKSPVEDLLPVSLEVREEQRKAAVALSVIMDCSCSMGATVPDGRTKMELAAEGVVGALELLNENDEAAVSMVDTEVHEIFGMRAVSDGLPLDKVARGFSGGGGIYVGVGMRKGKSDILGSRKATRHVLLFSDAADSEEPDDYVRTINELRSNNVTVSVIGLGSKTDPDAKLLEDVARRGGGRVYFAEDATSLPRIFSQETIAVARATFVDTPAPLKLGPDLGLLGKLGSSALPTVGGYNLTYLRPQASVGLRSADDNNAPVLAMWPRGAGRVVAYTGEVDGDYTGAMRGWGQYRAMLEQMVRWTMPAQVDLGDVVPRAVRQGNDLHVTIDFDPRAPPPEGTPTLVVLTGDAKSPPLEVPLRWEDEERMGAHYSLPGSGTFHPVVKLGNRVLRAPPVTLPYAPEFEPGTSAAGKVVLAAVAKLSGGVERLAMAGLFKDATESFASVPLSPFLIALALAALLAEVGTRRFFSGRRVRARVRSAVAAAVLTPAPAPRSAVQRPAKVDSVAKPNKVAPVAAAEPSPPPAEEPEAPKGGKSALDVARERARQRLRR